MQKPPRILYLVPERTVPTGGVNTSFEHVALLRNEGFDALVLEMNSQAPYPFATVEAPSLFLDQGVRFVRGDVLVLPEGSPEYFREMAAMPGVRRLLFCQNHFYFIHSLGRRTDWATLGLDGVFTCSREASDFVARTVGLPEVPVVPCAVDPALFRPRPKRLQVAFMPRKMPQELTSIRNILSWRRPELADVPWIPVDGVPRAEAARILGESAVFLSTSWYEGLGLPPLEAMACGCVVAGFHGWGGLDYAAPDNGLWCREGDLDAAADALAEALALAQGASPRLETLLARGAATAARYTPEAQRRALKGFWTRVLAGGFGA